MVALGSMPHISFAALAKRLGSLRSDGNVSPSTIFRWATKGLKAPDGSRVVLRAIRIGRTWATTEANVEAFIAALNPHVESTPMPRSPAARTTASKKAAETLDRLGVGTSRKPA